MTARVQHMQILYGTRIHYMNNKKKPLTESDSKTYNVAEKSDNRNEGYRRGIREHRCQRNSKGQYS